MRVMMGFNNLYIHVDNIIMGNTIDILQNVMKMKIFGASHFETIS